MAALFCQGLVALSLCCQALADGSASPQAIGAAAPSAADKPDSAKQQTAAATNLHSGAVETTSLMTTHVIKGANASIKLSAQDYVELGPLIGVKVEVENDTDQPLLFDGDQSAATSGTIRLPVATLADVEAVICPVKTKEQRLMHDIKASTVAAVTVGSVPAAGDARIQAGAVLQRYGEDQARRAGEQVRFGKRILWPGDTTSGVLYFRTDQSLRQFMIEMPVVVPN